jgi:hypothetical protein
MAAPFCMRVVINDGAASAEYGAGRNNRLSLLVASIVQG